jgi:hypothetical protein
MTTITVPRTGNWPLEFDGEELGTASSHTPEATRWHELAAYRTASGGHVLHVGFRSQWRGEPPQDAALFAESLAEAADYACAAALPAEFLEGYELFRRSPEKKAKIEGEVLARLSVALEAVLREAKGREEWLTEPSVRRASPSEYAEATYA